MSEAEMLERSAEQTRVSVRDLLFDYQHVLDARRWVEWPGFFTDDATYSVINVENEHHKGLYLYHDSGIEAIKERMAFVMGYWRSERFVTTRTLTNLRILSTQGDEIRTRAKFVLFRTGRDGRTTLHSCGEYQDLVVRAEERLRLQEHRVIIDNAMLPEDFTDLL